MGSTRNSKKEARKTRPAKSHREKVICSVDDPVDVPTVS